MIYYRYFNWKVIEALMASVLFFRKPLNAKAIEKLIQEQNRNRFWRPQWWKRSTVQNNNNNNSSNNINNNNSNNNNINSNNNNNYNNISQPTSPNINEYAFSPKINEFVDNNESLNPDKLESMFYDMLSSPDIRPIRHINQNEPAAILPSPELSPLPSKPAINELEHDDYNEYNISSSENKVEEDAHVQHYIKALRLSSDQLV